MRRLSRVLSSHIEMDALGFGAHLVEIFDDVFRKRASQELAKLDLGGGCRSWTQVSQMSSIVASRFRAQGAVYVIVATIRS